MLATYVMTYTGLTVDCRFLARTDLRMW